MMVATLLCAACAWSSATEGWRAWAIRTWRNPTRVHADRRRMTTMNHDIRAAQRGGLLLEALIGILLVSIGILAVVALQASATKAVTEAKFRSDASFLAD